MRKTLISRGPALSLESKSYELRFADSIRGGIRHRDGRDAEVLLLAK